MAGALATLIGLGSKPELNGKDCSIVGFDTAKGRYHVLPDGPAASTGEVLN